VSSISSLARNYLISTLHDSIELLTASSPAKNRINHILDLRTTRRKRPAFVAASALWALGVNLKRMNAHLGRTASTLEAAEVWQPLNL
jgi:hypothetical protein